MIETLKIALAQINPTMGDIDGNLALIRRRRAEAAALGADLMVTTTLWVNQMLMEFNEDFSTYLARPMMRYESQSAISYMNSEQWQFRTWDPVYLRTIYIPWRPSRSQVASVIAFGSLGSRTRASPKIAKKRSIASS